MGSEFFSRVYAKITLRLTARPITEPKSLPLADQ